MDYKPNTEKPGRFERRLTLYILVGLVAFIGIGVLLTVFFSGKVAEIFFWCVVAGLISFICGMEYQKRKERGTSWSKSKYRGLRILLSLISIITGVILVKAISLPDILSYIVFAVFFYTSVFLLIPELNDLFTG